MKPFISVLLILVFPFFSFSQIREVKESPVGISKRIQHEIEATMDPGLGYVPKFRLVQAQETRDRLLKNQSGDRNPLTWTERGPFRDVVGSSNGNTRAGNAITSGRSRSMWVDLADPTGNTVWVGGVAGGIWKTIDISVRPTNWISVNDFFDNLAIGSICQDPTDHNIMYFGTGEKAINADAVRGAGIWRSVDHGVTWALMSGTQNFWNVSKMICDAQGNLYVGCNTTSNSNAGMKRFTKATSVWSDITPSGLDKRVPDFVLSNTGRLHVICGYYNSSSTTSGYRYTDNPAGVTPTSWSSPSTTFDCRYNVTLDAVGNTLYALPSTSSWEVTTIYKSTDGGVNWAPTGATPSFTSGQAWYCMAVAIDPNNPNNVLVGSLDCYRSTNGGSSWSKVSNWVGTSGQYVHADQQAMIWRPNNRILVASDGGIHLSPDGGSTFSDRNENLRIKQFYSVAIHPTLTNYLLGGTQDNGMHSMNAPGLASSIEVTGGDGAFAHIDQTNGNYQFGSYVYNQYRRSTNGGSSWSSVNYSGSAGRFINPTDYDDANDNMYCSGNANQYIRWSSPATSTSFTAVSMTGLNNGKVSAVKVSPYTNHTVYFAGQGSGISSTLLKATNANATPSFTSIRGNLPTTGSAYISSIELGTSEQNIIVCYSNYGVSNVWVTNDGGTSWTDIDGNLPDMPVRWAMFYPGDNTKAIIATETGVWQTSLINGSSTVWNPEPTFPNTRTDMLQYRASDGLLAAATHGRGMFTANIGGGTPSCGTVAGLNASNITTSSATLNWSTVPGALHYDVSYKLNTSSTWIPAATATTALSVNVSGLSDNSLYDYRVRANCSAVSGDYSLAQFTTLSPTCTAPGGLTAANITTSSATISWGSVSGGLSYDVDVKLNTSSTWTNVATATTSLSINLTGLTSNSLYDYRVRTNCSGGSSTYSQAQFTTLSVSCDSPTGLAASSVTTTTATVSWSAVSGGLSYDVSYKVNTSSTWITAVTATTSLSVNLTNLTPGTLYDYRVRTNCSGGSSAFSQAQFTTTASTTCPGTYDAGNNNTLTNAVAVPFNTDIYGLINPSGDYDYYSFQVTTGGSLTITLTQLPKNYDLYLYNANGSQITNSRKNGTANESITRTLNPGTYYVLARGKGNGDWHATNCYNLRIQLGTATNQDFETEDLSTNPETTVNVFPNPAFDRLNIYIIGNINQNLAVYTMTGQLLYSQEIHEMLTTLDISELTKGGYLIRITDREGNLTSQKTIIKE
jgi:hypothetical protein